MKRPGECEVRKCKKFCKDVDVIPWYNEMKDDEGRTITKEIGPDCRDWTHECKCPQYTNCWEPQE